MIIRRWRYAIAALAVMACHPASAQQMVAYSSGTGFFVTRSGYVVTNHHVINDCSSITVSGAVPLSSATLVAGDSTYDLALLKTRASPLAEARLSSAKQPVRANDHVIVVGYPGEAWQTGRTVMREATIIQTQGPFGEEKWIEMTDSLAHGNSGGPLLDRIGNVIGVVTAKASLITAGSRDAHKEAVQQFDLAISLPVLRRFLGRNGIAYSQEDSGRFSWAGSAAENARRFIVNVRCRLNHPPANAAKGAG